MVLSSISYGQNFSDLKTKFDQSAQPLFSDLESGWHIGHCYTKSEPQIKKSGVLFILKDSAEKIKIVIPIGSIRVPSDYYENLDEDKISELKNTIWPQNMDYAYFENGMLKNILIYDIPTIISGLMSLRKDSENLMLKYSDLEGESEFFYCQFANPAVTVPSQLLQSY